MLSPSTSSKKIKKSSSSSKKQPLNNKSPTEPSSSNLQKSSNFTRIFTPEDELKILQAVVDTQQHNPIPSKAAATIFNNIKDELSAQVKPIQLGEKIRKLRDRYCKGTNDAVLKSHQKQLSMLCKDIWEFKKSSIKQKMFKDDDDMGSVKDDDFVKKYSFLMKEVSMAPNNFVCIDNLKYLDGSVLQELDERWRKQHLMETQHFLERLDLAKEYVELVLDAFASSSKGKNVVDDEEAMAVDDADDELVGDGDDEEEAEVKAGDGDDKEEIEVKAGDVKAGDDDDEEEAEVKAGDVDDKNEQSEDVDDEEEAEVKAGDDDDENEQSEDVDDEEEAEVEDDSDDE